ncbi:MAG: phosphatase PAP2 family protein [Rikenellaceae bacterium]|jgi:undecaprenyl-diphosphatase|nr:phosphatase PAP2 family protein [Rikenellaceae bacterium]
MKELDRSLFLSLNFDGGPALDSFFWHVSKGFVWIPLYALLAYLFLRRFGWRGMLLAVGAMALAVVTADQIANIFKYSVQKLRPTHTPEFQGIIHTVRGYAGGLYGTVSAHAATTAAIATFASLIFHRRWVATLLAVWTVLVAYSRIYLGAHFPADLLFGFVDGCLLGWLGYKLFLWLDAKRQRD